MDTMHPTNLLDNFSSTLCSFSGSLTNKETQTSVTSLTYSTPSIQLIVRPINCDVVEEVSNKEKPETVIKDTFSEDVIDSNTSEEKTQLKRDSFCREMIVPNSKLEKKIVLSNESDFNPSPDSTRSLKGTKKKIFANIDPKDYKNYKEPEQTKNIEHNRVKRNKCSNCSKNNKLIEKNKCPDCKKISNTENRIYLVPDENCDENAACEALTISLSEDTESCISKCLGVTNKPDSECKEKDIRNKQGTCSDENPTNFVIESNPEILSNNNDTKTSLFSSCNETISNMTNTIQSFIGTVCQKTKDVVCMVSSESFQQLNLRTSSKSYCDDYYKENISDLTLKKSKISTCGFLMRTEEPKPMAAESSSLQTIMQPAMETAKIITSTVESVSCVNYLSTEKIITKKIESAFNESSPLDDPTIIQPRVVTQTIDPMMHNINHVFEAIKSKIFSMFGDSTTDDSDYFDEE